MNSPNPRQHRLYFPRFIAVSSLAGLAAGIVAACSDIDGPKGPKVSVCHTEASVSAVREIFLSELAGHRGHGDYITQLEVDKLNTPGDDIHYTRITDALAAAKAGRLARNELEKAACRITIAVAPGTLQGSTAASSNTTFERFPLIIDIPDITLKGALRMQLDASGRPTGAVQAGDPTTIAPSPALLATPGLPLVRLSDGIIVVNGHPDGPKGHGAVIEGFVFQSGHAATATDTIEGGQAILSLRATGLVVTGNRFEGRFTEFVDLRASSALVERNHFSRKGSSCDLCLAGPGSVVIRDNRLTPGGRVGLLISPAALLPVPPGVEQYTLPASAVLTALVTNNEVRGHLEQPVGVAVRIMAIGVGAPNVAGTTKVTMTGNALVNNTFGIMVDAGFPIAGTALRGDVELTTSGNTITGSCQNDLLVTFSRHLTALGLQPGPYVRNSAYTLTLGSDATWDKAWFDNSPGFGNTLVVNGQTMASGRRAAYDASRVCAP